MQHCSIFWPWFVLVLFRERCIEKRKRKRDRGRKRDREGCRESERKHSQNLTTPCRENISCVAGLQNMLPGF